MASKLEQNPLVIQLAEHLKRMGLTLKCFDTGAEAVDYLDSAIDGVSVGIGGSITVKELELYPRLAAHNQVDWHWEGGSLERAAQADVYISSVNAIAATGEIVNIDGTCNRVTSALYGHKKVYYVTGINKLTQDFHTAMDRARNVAAPLNARRLGRNTPCAVKADKCYNCSSPERICRAATVLWEKSGGVEEMEVVLIGQELGY